MPGPTDAFSMVVLAASLKAMIEDGEILNENNQYNFRVDRKH
jgi:hypothetical protein